MSIHRLSIKTEFNFEQLMRGLRIENERDDQPENLMVTPPDLRQALNVYNARVMFRSVRQLRKILTTRFPWDKSPLDRLPSNVRTRIWEFAVTEQDPIAVAIFPVELDNGKRVVGEVYRPDCSLAFTCRKIREECLPIWYRKNTFDVPLNELADGFKGSLKDCYDPEEFYQKMAQFQFDNWAYRSEPLVHFIHKVKKVGVTNLSISINIGTFDMSVISARENLLFTLLRLNTFLLPHQELFGGDCWTHLGIVMERWTSPSKNMNCVDHKNFLRCCRLHRRYFERRALKQGVDSERDKMASSVFKILEERYE